jgi:DNA-binding MarR family transcriptional regulator
VSRISAYDRRRLIEQRVAFIVPGTQAYLPSLLLDLRERFQSSAAPRSSERLSPSTQAVLLNVIYNRIADLDGITAPRGFGRYSKMTLSRAIAELRQYGLVQTEAHGRTKRGHFSLSGRELWEKSLPHLRSPIRKTIYVTAEELARIPPGREAGLTALARLSLINQPALGVFAYHQRFSVAEPNRGIFRATPHAEEAAAQIELWAYDPLPEARPQPTVDRLSLFLTLKDDPDERVQAALEALMKGVF